MMLLPLLLFRYAIDMPLLLFTPPLRRFHAMLIF